MREAAYHLGFEYHHDQPIIHIHMHPDYLDELAAAQSVRVRVDRGFGVDLPFALDPEAFGYGGVGALFESERIDNWITLGLPVPEATLPVAPANPESRDTAQHVSLILSTASVVLDHLNYYSHEHADRHDEGHPQFLTVSFANYSPLDEPASATFTADFSRAMLLELARRSYVELGVAEEWVQEAMYHCAHHPYGACSPEDFNVDLDDGVRLGFPDSPSFIITNYHNFALEGTVLVTRRNIQAPQLLGLFGAMAALNDVPFLFPASDNPAR